MLPHTEIIKSLIARVMRIEQELPGDQKKKIISGFSGRLYSDPAEAYAQLDGLVKGYNITPLFRKKGDNHLILLLEGRVKKAKSNILVNLILFVLTLVSVIFSGALFFYDGAEPSNTTELIKGLYSNLDNGLAFGISLLAILLAHEFGHYLAAKWHKVDVTLPYFLPFPLSPFGTMGAFIRLKEPPRNKRELLDIGLAGPLAGFVVAIPILILGLSLSKLAIIQIEAGKTLILEGNSIIYLLSKYLVFGEWLPSPESYEGLPPLIHWARYLFTGRPIPIGGLDVTVHPIAWAGWAGLLVTALNLIPAGQLDGGHIIYSIFGDKARYVLPLILVGLVLLGLVWFGWWIWAFLIFMFGGGSAQPLDQITGLNRPRKLLAVVGLVVFILVFTPVPLIQMSGLGF